PAGMAQTSGPGHRRRCRDRCATDSAESVESVFPNGPHRAILGRHYAQMTSAPAQHEVNRVFTANASYWGDVYRPDDHSFDATVFRARQAAAMTWIDTLALPSGARVLEVGCGAGFLTLALAQRGFRTDAIDGSDTMVETTRKRIATAGLAALAT